MRSMAAFISTTDLAMVTSFAFEAIVLASRNISWLSRNSSLVLLVRLLGSTMEHVQIA